MSSFIQVEMSNKQLDTQISVFTPFPSRTRFPVTQKLQLTFWPVDFLLPPLWLQNRLDW